MTFHILGRIIPTDELIFFRGVGITPSSFVAITQAFFGIAHHEKPAGIGYSWELKATTDWWVQTFFVVQSDKRDDWLI